MSKAKPKEESDHAELSASGSERWLNCAGSVNLIRSLPVGEIEPSRAAAEGTRAHELLEKWLKHMRDGMGGFVFPNGYSESMITAVREAIADVSKTWKRPTKKELVIEKKVSLERLVMPGMFGTADIGIVEYFGVLEIADYKHGEGILVDVEKPGPGGLRTLNTQLVYYALALADEYDFNFSHVRLKIIQPRARQSLTTIRSALVPIKELKMYIDLFKRGVERTQKKDAKRYAGPWCKFCPAKIICKEGQSAPNSNARYDFDPIN